MAFGMRKALDCEYHQSDLQAEYERLTQERAELEFAFVDLKQRADIAERRQLELRTTEEKAHAEEVSFLKKTNQQLKVEIVALNFLVTISFVSGST